MPLIILGGIYGGVFTPTEAAAVTVIYAIPVGALIYKGLSLRRLIESLAQAAETTGIIIAILLFSFITGRIFTLEGIPQELTEFIVERFDNKFIVLLIVNLLLIFLGIILEDVILTVVVSPLLLPAMVSIGVHPIQFGAIVGTSVVIAANSPPTAPILYMACRIGNVRAVEAMKPALVFMIFAALPVQLLTSYWPPLSLYLPGLFGYLD
jgi:tripartite ATP-independent transporter DctM subunit